MTNHFRSLRVTSTFLVGAAFLTGLASTWIWMQSNADWRAHQEAAFLSGVTVYNALLNGTSASSGVTLQPLSPADAALAAKGQFGQLSGAPRGARITNVPIRADAAATVMGEALLMVIVSPEITYKLADLPRRDNQTAAETTGTVFRLIASFCSDPLVIARKGGGDWIRIEGASVWGCGVAPPDHRLPAAILGIVMMAGLLTVALNISAEFTQFAEQLRSRRRLGGPTRYAIEGPRELQDIVSAVNSYLEAERDQLESRAAVLSGVSHDLGTPATRLRLRTALIRDETLRRKFDADIDRMTGMIESVLTYTRAEMSVEDPRKLSLKSLVEAVVADYQDMDRAVTLTQPRDRVVQGGRSVFMSRQGQGVLARDGDVIVTGRPVALERAITNLIDNALKYGRRATVSLEADATWATVLVEDYGSENSAAEIEALIAPFKRGENANTIEGYGLGLTIVATIALLHGGSLGFEDGAHGVRARLSTRRN